MLFPSPGTRRQHGHSGNLQGSTEQLGSGLLSQESSRGQGTDNGVLATAPGLLSGEWLG
jgi:hypothetical protein